MSKTIAEQIPDLQEDLAGKFPSAVADAFLREQHKLAAVSPERVIEPGERLPDAVLLDPHGALTALSEALAGRWGVLVFYRGAWCPYCNLALRTYQTVLVPELERRGAQMVAVSPQWPDGSLTMQEANELTFSVLSDPGNVLAGAAGIITAPSEEARAAQLELGLELDQVNADGTTALPMPTTIILDPDLTVRWIDVHPDYSTRSEPNEILAALDALPDA